MSNFFARKNRMLSVLVLMAFLFTLVSPAAFAANGDFDYVVSGNWNSPDTKEVQVMTIGSMTLESVSVSDGASYDMTIDGKDCTNGKTAKGTMPNGTTFEVYTNSARDVMFRLTSELKDDCYVTYEEGYASYNIQANSGYYGYGSNRGGADTCSISADETESVAGGETYEVTFSPKQNQEIVKINIRSAAEGAVDRIFDAKSQNVTIAGQDVAISKNGDDITVRFKVSSDMYLTALTQNLTDKHNLSVTTDSRTSSDVTNEDIESGQGRTVKFTPKAGYNVSTISITDGNQTGSIAYDETSTTVNGKTYRVSRSIDGSAVLTIPAMNADVQVSAVSESSIAYVKVNTTSRVDSRQEGIHFLSLNSSLTITYSPDREDDIRTIYCKTPKGTYSAEPGDAYFIIEGNYYSMYTRANGDISINLNGISTNMEFSVNSRNNSHDDDYYDKGSDYDVTLRTNGSCSARYDGYTVDRGDDLAVSFYPDDDDYDIVALKVSYNGRTYTADVYEDSYIDVYDDRWDIDVASDGEVTLYMENIRYNVTVTASTDFRFDGRYDDVRLSEYEDSHSNISWTGSNPFDYGEDTTITVTTDYDYIIDHIRFQQDDRSAIVEPFDETFTLNGRTYDVDWDSNRNVSIDMDDLRDDIRISAYSERGDEKDYSGSNSSSKNGKYVINRSEDSHGNITWTGNNRYNYGDSKTVTVKADSGYVIKTVRFQMGGSNVTISPFQKTFSLGGKTHNVNWSTNRNASVNIGPLTNDLRVSITTAKGSLESANNNNVTDNTITNSASFHPAYMTGMGNGYFGAGDNLTRAQAVSLLVRAISGNTNNAGIYPHYYSDVKPGAWYADVVNYAASEGYLDVIADKNGRFDPEGPITRAEFLALVCKFQHIDVSKAKSKSQYNDVANNHWAAKYINYCTDRGWVGGTGNDNFAPDRTITRAEIATMTNHILGRIPDYTKAAQNGPSFNDVPITHWAFNEIFEASHAHYGTVVNGVETWS